MDDRKVRFHELSPGTAAAVTSAVVLLVYLVTLRSVVGYEDVAEFQTIAAVGGVPHSGYPLQVLLLRLASEIPFSTIAWRANLVSALSGAASAGLLAYLVTRLSGRAWAGCAAGIARSLSLAPWQNAVRAEVYPTSTLLQVLLLFAIIAVMERPSAWRVLRAGLAGGASLLGHLGALGLGLPAVLAVLVPRGAMARWQRALLAILGVAIGLLPMLLVPHWDRTRTEMNALADELQPEMPWHEVSSLPPGHPQRALWLVSGQMFLTQHKAGALAIDAPRRLSMLAVDLVVNELPFVGLPLAAIGLAWLARRRRGLTVVLVLWVAGQLALEAYAGYANVLPSFFLPGVWVVALWAGLGIAAIAERTRAVAAVLALALVASPLVRVSMRQPPPFVAASSTASDVWREWPENWDPFHPHVQWERFGRGVMRALPPNAVVISCWDEGTVLRYFRWADVLRTDVDVRFACKTPALLERYLLEARVAGRPVYTTFDPRPQGFGALLVNKFPHGELWRITTWLRR